QTASATSSLYFGTRFHRGASIKPAIPSEIPSPTKIEGQISEPTANREVKAPGKVTPIICPSEPNPLMTPLAVAAPRLLPKSMAAAPASNESGMNTRNPIRNIPAPMPTRDTGTYGKTIIKRARQNKERIQIGIRLEPKSLSE